MVTLEPTQKPLKVVGPVNSKYHLGSALSAYRNDTNGFLLKLGKRNTKRKTGGKEGIKKREWRSWCEIYWTDRSSVESGWGSRRLLH
jgi:hypothetical protein